MPRYDEGFTLPEPRPVEGVDAKKVADPDATPLAKGLHRLDDNMDQLSKLLHQLGMRLTPVSSEESQDMPTEAGTPHPGSSPHVRDINNSADRLMVLIHTVRNMLDELEL